MDVSQLSEYMIPGRHAHLVGIGGVSMSPLAEVLHSIGLTVTGSDINEGDSVRHLRSLGIEIAIGHSADNIEGAEFIVRTAAAHDDNPEIAAARAAGVPVFERAQAWGYIMRSYKNAICIAGTHGKTTTTSMMTHILMSAHCDPTVMIGGTLPLLGAGHRVGKGDSIIMESCEYFDSFLSFSPTVAVILNIEADHLDYFKDLEDIQKSFRAFAAKVPENGSIVCCGDDGATMEALLPLGRELITFGTGELCTFRAVNIETHGAGSEFDVVKNGEGLGHVTLRIPGIHNVKDAVAAIAAASCLGISVEACAEGLRSFTGAKRRFQFKGHLNGADVYDDYAHHPGELKALLDAAKTLPYERVIVAFQPHTYTRTKALFSDFVRELSRADKTYLAEIYAAREKNTVGISSRDLAAAIPGAEFCPDFEGLEEKLRADARKGDIVLTVGAGDIYKVAEAVAAD